MPTDLPIACSLTATQLPRRLAEMAELGRDALLSAHVNAGHGRPLNGRATPLRA